MKTHRNINLCIFIFRFDEEAGNSGKVMMEKEGAVYGNKLRGT